MSKETMMEAPGTSIEKIRRIFIFSDSCLAGEISG
jgi:hypothetical protein